MGIRFRHTLIAAVAVASSLLAAVPAASARDSLRYVALGDSAAAGPLIPHQSRNIACLRSDINYPRVAAAKLGATLRDMTCSGADIADFSGRQYGLLPPQYDALTPDTDLVTITIGGNDVRLVRAALSCFNFFPEPAGRSCADRYTAGGKDELGSRIARVQPRFAEVLDQVRRRAPKAQVVVVGYGTYLPPDGCFPKAPLWPRDANYMQATVDRLSAMLHQEAQAHDAMFVDLAALSRGHDVCAPPEQRYFEGIVPSSAAAPLHPNAKGMEVFGQAVADAVHKRSVAR